MINIFTRFPFSARLTFYLLFVQLFISADVFSQGKFLDGYVISPKGDTLNGFIRYEGWEESPVYIDFTTEKNGTIQKLTSEQIKQFFIPSINEKYKSKKIGVLDINLSQTYAIAPSLQTKDSSTVFLREVTSGAKVTLLEYINTIRASHYFLEKDKTLTELINYPFYRLIGEKKFLLTYDEYKNQLPVLLSDSESFKMQLPGYDQKALRKYIEKYNESFIGEKHIKQLQSQQESDFTVDLTMNLGPEGWKEHNMDIGYKISYGLGVRINLPRKFNNRYFRLNLLLMPKVPAEEVYGYNYGGKVSLQTLEFGVGSHLGSGKIRPYIGIDYSFPLKTSWRSVLLGPHFGVSYRRQFSIEISHFANVNTLFSEVPFANRPRLSFNYFLNLNGLFKKK